MTRQAYVDAADADDDGDVDIVVGNNESFSVLLNNGTGAFSSTTYSSSFGDHHPKLGDLNDDGVLDLAIAKRRFFGNSVAIYLGNGDGTFTFVADNNLIGGTGFPDSPTDLEFGDLNRDGYLDLAATDATLDAIGLFLGNGDGLTQCARF